MNSIPRTLNELGEAFGWPLPRQRDDWRVLFPASGYLIGERVTILATNGCLAAFTKNWVTLEIGHLANFIGPASREEVWAEDWDWIANRRKVKWQGFPVPQDSIMDAHWARHEKASKEWLELEAAVGRGAMPPEDFQRSWDALQAKKERVSQKSKFQELYDSI